MKREPKNISASIQARLLARLRVYRPETSIAEKTEAMVRLALANSRMKDFFDIRGLAITRPFDGDTLRLALAATFERRQTPLPSETPLALTKEFGDDRQKGRQWAAFVGRIRGADHPDLSEVIDVLRAFLWPVLQAAAKGDSLASAMGAWRALDIGVSWPRQAVKHSTHGSTWGAKRGDNRQGACWPPLSLFF